MTALRAPTWAFPILNNGRKSSSSAAGRSGWRSSRAWLARRPLPADRAGRRHHRHAENERGERPHHGVLPALGHRRPGAELSVPGGLPLDGAFVTSLAGHELGRIARPARAHQTPEPYSPSGCRPARRCGSIRSCVIWRVSSVAWSRASPPGSKVRPHGGVTARNRISRPGRAHRGRLSGRLRRRHERDPRARHRLLGQGMLGHPLHLFFRAPDLLKRCRKPGTFFLAIDRAGPGPTSASSIRRTACGA